MSFIVNIFLYKNGPVGMWRANGNPNLCIDLDEILHTHTPSPVQESFWCRFDPHPSPLGLRGLKPYELKDKFLKTVYKTKDVQQVANQSVQSLVPQPVRN